MRMKGIVGPIPSTSSEKIDGYSCVDADGNAPEQPRRFHHHWPIHHHHHHHHGGDMQAHLLSRRRTPDAVTESTKSMLSGSVGGQSSSSEPMPPPRAGRRFPRLMMGGRLTLLPRRTKKGTRWSESQLRKLAKKNAANGDWNAVRKLIGGHKFADVPEGYVPRRPGGGGGGEVGQQQAADPSSAPQDATMRRPSYGSQGRRSFNRETNSAAAAAVIKAANLEEYCEEQLGEGGRGVPSGGPASSSSPSHLPNNPLLADNRPDYGENILHDLCRFHPPSDVIETLLFALNRRRGCTIGTDDAGRTPMHVAAECGAGVDVLRALVQADPTPASRGDVYRRSPLHLAMRYCVFHYQPNPHDHHHQSGNNKMLSPEDVMEETLEVVQVLKEAMLDYPGKVGFKDEDASGYSPLDYAIDGDISNEKLIHALIRRRDPKRMHLSSSLPTREQMMVHTTKRGAFSLRSSSNRSSARSSSNCSVCSSSTGVTGGDIDIEVLQRLERDEIEARTLRINKMKARRRLERMNYSLFDAFGIDEQRTGTPVIAAAALSASVPATVAPIATTTAESVLRKIESQTRVENGPTEKAPTEVPAKEVNKAPRAMEMSDVEIYNKHLQDYLDGHLEEFAGVLEQCDDDGFDIFEDPELDDPPLPPTWKPPEKVALTWVDDDCASVVSEITIILN
ncbi:hypothetical protein ACHAXA_000725 [Cyclostephanos tholiformis]|uniref:Uncharacterized protein n=1 Tax=Cyclostephanos tholiformis TaxID=382380 RepID=A0ABD3RRH5_9STRA